MKTVDGMEVEVSTVIRARVSEYTLYDGKVWRITGYYGPAVGDSKTLEREVSGEKISVSNKEKLYKVIEPTGYIRI